MGCGGGVWGARLERCHAFMPVPGPLQTVQRAECWGAINALQSPTGPVTKALTTPMLQGQLVGCWIMAVWKSPCLWSKLGIWLLWPST